VKGIEPSCVAWKATVLPLNYTRGAVGNGVAACGKRQGRSAASGRRGKPSRSERRGRTEARPLMDLRLESEGYHEDQAANEFRLAPICRR
jgi:hypothetical protein